MSIENNIENLKKYIDEDDIYTRYKNGEYTEISDFELFCINHCKDIEVVLGNLDALCDMQRTADRELKNARQINEEHKKINGELREKVKELECENKENKKKYLALLIGQFPDTTETYKKYKKQLQELLQESEDK